MVGGAWCSPQRRAQQHAVTLATTARGHAKCACPHTRTHAPHTPSLHTTATATATLARTRAGAHTHTPAAMLPFRDITPRGAKVAWVICGVLCVCSYFMPDPPAAKRNPKYVLCV